MCEKLREFFETWKVNCHVFYRYGIGKREALHSLKYIRKLINIMIFLLLLAALVCLLYFGIRVIKIRIAVRELSRIGQALAMLL